MTNDDLTQWEAAARKAIPMTATDDLCRGECCRDQRAYIALSSPDRVLALIARVRALEAKVKA